MFDKLKAKYLSSKELKNAGWLISGRVIQMVLSFFISIFTARFLGPGNYGVINYASAYVAFFTSLCTLGINSVIIKDFAEHPQEQGKAIGTTLVLRGVSSALSTLMIIGIVGILENWVCSGYKQSIEEVGELLMGISMSGINYLAQCSEETKE